MSEYTKGPWHVGGQHKCTVYDKYGQRVADAFEGVMTTQRTDAGCRANAHLIAAAPELLEALHEGRRAIGDHHAPNDCYATGPLTGDEYRDLVQCPACSFIAMYDAAIAKAKGETP